MTAHAATVIAALHVSQRIKDYGSYAGFACVLGLSEGEIPRLEQDLGCINVIDFDDTGRALVRLANLSAHDPLKADLREPSFERLRRVLEARGEALAGLRWQGVERDPEV